MPGEKFTLVSCKIRSKTVCIANCHLSTHTVWWLLCIILERFNATGLLVKSPQGSKIMYLDLRLFRLEECLSLSADEDLDDGGDWVGVLGWPGFRLLDFSRISPEVGFSPIIPFNISITLLIVFTLFWISIWNKQIRAIVSKR